MANVAALIDSNGAIGPWKKTQGGKVLIAALRKKSRTPCVPTSDFRSNCSSILGDFLAEATCLKFPRGKNRQKKNLWIVLQVSSRCRRFSDSFSFVCTLTDRSRQSPNCKTVFRLHFNNHCVHDVCGKFLLVRNAIDRRNSNFGYANIGSLSLSLENRSDKTPMRNWLTKHYCNAYSTKRIPQTMLPIIFPMTRSDTILSDRYGVIL